MTDHHNCSAGSEHPQISFLREAANYFRNRPTHGEDRAFWSNVANADNCEKAANLIERMLDAAQPVAVSEARERVLAAIADLQGEHEVMAGPFDPTKWKIDISVSDLQALASQPSPAATVETRGSGVEMIDNLSPEALANWQDDGNCNAGRPQCSAANEDALEALRVLLEESDISDLHGGDHHEDGCPTCEAIKTLERALTSTEPQTVKETAPLCPYCFGLGKIEAVGVPEPAERCLTCGRSDAEYKNCDWTCNDPWHADTHLRRSPVTRPEHS